MVGELTLDYEAFELPGEGGQRVNIYTAAPDSPSAAALDLLAGWSIQEPLRNAPTSARGHGADSPESRH